jgi:uncharacterized protein (TIGR02246 family)
MSDDEAQIRHLVARWHAATSAGDTATVLDLMTDDVVFLAAGRSPMNKAEFSALSAPADGVPRPKIEFTQHIREVCVAGDVAYMWSELAVSILPAGASRPIGRQGHTLTIFRKQNNTWKLARDANLLASKREDS